ncbi:MAG: DoxX family protein [Hyphomicrobiales bacterium]|nr:DoxX family protein [Hyphomicrobiales bacterium]
MIDNQTAPYAALILRVSMGVLFIAHGLLKVLVFTIPGTVAFFESLGLPAIAAYATIAAELIGGVALILGIGTRVVALGLIPLMLGATWAHLGNGWVFSAEGGGWEFPAFWTVMLAVQALLGSGAYAVNLTQSGSANGAPARA